MEIRKKIWPKGFEKIKAGEKIEIRLADFECSPGDTLVLEEWDPETKKYTGRKIEKKVANVVKIDLVKFYKLKDIKSNGIYVIELVE